MIELIFERTWLQIKGMKAMFAIPFVGYYVLIPLGVWAMSYSVDFVLSDAIAQMCYLLVPFLSTWWIYLMAKEFVEGSGREVLLSSSGGLINMLIYEFINMLLCHSFVLCKGKLYILSRCFISNRTIAYYFLFYGGLGILFMLFAKKYNSSYVCNCIIFVDIQLSFF